jgi:regulator of sigma E protease
VAAESRPFSRGATEGEAQREVDSWAQVATTGAVGFASIVLAIIAVGVLIIIHEAGHFFAARWSGMSVSRFSIGFGPSIARVRRGETEFQVGAIPLGGFVQIDGMSPGDGTDPDAPGSFASRPFHQKFAAILAGSAANYVLGFALLVFFYAVFAYEPRPPVLVKEVVADSPAATAGLMAGDQLVGTASAAFARLDDFPAAIAARGGEPVDFLVERGGQRRVVTVDPEPRPGGGFIIGIAYEAGGRVKQELSLGEAAGRSLDELWRTSAGTVLALAALVTPGGSAGVSGPIGIVQGLSARVEKSLSDALAEVARLSIALGFFNLLPIPALDGSRLLFLFVGLVRRRPVDARLEQLIHVSGLVLLLALMVLVSIKDIMRWVTG